MQIYKTFSTLIACTFIYACNTSSPETKGWSFGTPHTYSKTLKWEIKVGDYPHKRSFPERNLLYVTNTKYTPLTSDLITITYDRSTFPTLYSVKLDIAKSKPHNYHTLRFSGGSGNHREYPVIKLQLLSNNTVIDEVDFGKVNIECETFPSLQGVTTKSVMSFDAMRISFGKTGWNDVCHNK